jgi:hypothetical protein
MQVPLQSNYYDCGIFICLYAAFLDIRLPLSFSQHDTRNARTWMAHEMTEEGKLLKMIHRVLHDSLLASATGNSAPTSDNSTAISRSTTDTVDTTSTATTTGDQQQSKRSSESQLQGAIKRQRTYEPENVITKPPDLTDLHHQQQKSPDTVNTEAPKGDNPDISNRVAASITAIEEEKNVLASAEFWAIMQTTHGLQSRAASANEITPKTEPGTTSKQQEEALLENVRNLKRRRGSDGQYTEPITRATLLGDVNTMKDTSTSRPDTSKCIQVGRNTFVLRKQPKTPSSHHVEESITFYDSSAKPKRRPGSSTRKRMKHHHP